MGNDRDSPGILMPFRQVRTEVAIAGAGTGRQRVREEVLGKWEQSPWPICCDSGAPDERRDGNRTIYNLAPVILSIYAPWASRN